MSLDLPITKRLEEGVKFDFDTLASHSDDVENYLEWWWDRVDLTTISRPEILEDQDAILEETINKSCVDLVSYQEMFDDFLLKAIDGRKLPAKDSVSREEFGNAIIRLVGSNSLSSTDRPTVVFAGGGYGSGKSTIVGGFAELGKFPVSLKHMIGVDMFKHYIPEYCLISEVGDGRASVTVQKECVKLASKLFGLLIQARRSFIWDSSMSNESETLSRIQTLKSAGYEIEMVAILTPLQLAVRRAMLRAKEERRFPNAKALPDSHIGFRKAFPNYIAHFDQITVVANDGEGLASAKVIAEKTGLENQLVIHDQTVFDLLLVG